MSETYFYNGEEISENQLILRIRSGEEDMFSLLTSAYLPVINKYLSTIDCSISDKEDFVQIGLLALYGAVDAYDFSSSSFSTFVSLCVKRAIVSELRRVSSKKQIPHLALVNIDDTDLSDDNDPETAVIDKEDIGFLVDRIKSALSEFEYQVLNAYLKFGGYTETARALNVTVKEVNNALQRARIKIRKSIGKVR